MSGDATPDRASIPAKTPLAMTWGGYVWHIVINDADDLACRLRPMPPRVASWARFWQRATYEQSQGAPITKVCSRCRKAKNYA